MNNVFNISKIKRKVMKGMKLSAVMFASLFAGTMFAQVPTKRPVKSAETKKVEAAPAPAKEKLTNEERAEKVTSKMEKELELTPEQRPKIYELNLGVAMKNEAIRNDANMTKEQKKEALEMNRENRKSALKMYLTEAQYAKMEEKEAMQQKHKEMQMQMKKEKMKEGHSHGAEELEEL